MVSEQVAVSEADVVVVGGGGSGLAAAAEAARVGRGVILLEKNPQPGGSTSWSVGSVTATNTPHQKRAGIQDSPQEHFEDLAAHAGALAPRDNLALRRILVDHTTDMLEWLMRLGVVFVGPMPEPPHRYPRMHNVVPNSKSFAYHLSRHCRQLGVDIRTNVTSERLIEERGRVVAVEATTAPGERHVFRARGGVVLASGDYSGAADLKGRLASADLAHVEAVNASSTGDGHRMALAVGATVVNGDIVRGPIMRFIPPTRANLIQKLPPAKAVAQSIAWAMGVLPQWILRPFLMSFLTTALGPSPDLFREGAILVNNRGERFTDELTKPAPAVAQQPERIAYIVFDDALAQRFGAWPHFVSTAPGVAYAYLADYRRNRGDIYHEAGSLAALAKSMRVPAENLAATFERYNGSERGSRPALAQKPYFALGPVKSYVVFTDGGLKVSERLEVLRADGTVIPGLYAAGSAGQGGLLLEGHGHHLGWAFISGRIAGRNAAFGVTPPVTLASDDGAVTQAAA
ncbi:MAG TPA: FAD-dependent oxidoreductase [Burkholderiales bacterium]|nr:FAD-dependent oxidoreductase [Burkholderiales bacterium]